MAQKPAVMPLFLHPPCTAGLHVMFRSFKDSKIILMVLKEVSLCSPRLHNVLISQVLLHNELLINSGVQNLTDWPNGSSVT